MARHVLYFRLPRFSMKNKRIQFRYIKDRVAKKLQIGVRDYFLREEMRCSFNWLYMNYLLMPCLVSLS